MTYDLPLPINNGSRMRTWNFINALSTQHELNLLSFEKDCNQEKLEILKKYFSNVWLANSKINLTKKNRLNEKLVNLKFFLKGIPREIQYSLSSEYEVKFLDIISNHNFDIILSRYIYPAHYLFKHIRKLKSFTVVDLDDIGFVKSERLLVLETKESSYKTLRNKLNNYLLKRYHKRLHLISRKVVCSNEDKNRLSNNNFIKNISIIPNSIDTFYYSNVSNFNKEAFDRKIILFCGTLNYIPNIDGLNWFVKEIFPLISKYEPKARLNIVGLNPEKEIFELSDRKHIFVFPNVPSVLPFYEESSLVIIPIRAAAGTRVKILEALSARRPIISTKVGAEGLDLINNRHCIIEDSTHKFASACLKLLNNYNASSSLTEEGYLFVKEKYDKKVVCESILKLFDSKSI